MSEIALLAAHWVTWWLALTLATRPPRSRAALLVAGALCALSVHFLATAYLSAPEHIGGRIFWCDGLSSVTDFAPTLLLHGLLLLSGVSLRGRRTILIVSYATAGVLFVLGLGDSVYADVPATRWFAGDNYVTFAAGRYYWLEVVHVLFALGLGAYVVLKGRAQIAPADKRRAQLGYMAASVILMFVGSAAMFFNALAMGLIHGEAVASLPLMIGCLMVAVAVGRYGGTIEGQLLRSDWLSSGMIVAAVMVVFAIIVVAVGASFLVFASLGWLLVAASEAGDSLCRVTDRIVYSASERAARDGLRTVATYAGGGQLDASVLGDDQMNETAAYLVAIDRATVAAARMSQQDPLLDVLSLEEFAAVRSALGIPAEWCADEQLDDAVTYAHVLSQLSPRRRQVLGLSHLGYSSAEIASLLGLGGQVPQTYIAQARSKLGLARGAQTRMFVHFSGIVVHDALPLLLTSRNVPDGRPNKATIEEPKDVRV